MEEQPFIGATPGFFLTGGFFNGSMGGVVSTPSILVSTTNLTFTDTVISTTSDYMTFTVSGTNLSTSIIVTCASGYQISLSPSSGYVTTTLTLPLSSGSVPATIIYVQAIPLLPQEYLGAITCSSTGATTRNVMVDVFGVYDPDAILYFNQLTGVVPQNYKVSISYFVTGVKSDGNWPSVSGAGGRMFIHAAPNQQNARISISNPTSNPITEINGVAWTQYQGYTGANLTWLDYNYVPTTEGVNKNSWGFSIYPLLNQSSDLSYIFGGVSGSVPNRCETRLILNYTAFGKSYNVNAEILPETQLANTVTSGFFTVIRTASNAQAIWLNGSSIGTSSKASNGTPASKLLGLAYNNGGSGQGVFFSTNQIALTFMHDGALDIAKMNTRVASLKAEIGF